MPVDVPEDENHTRDRANPFDLDASLVVVNRDKQLGKGEFPACVPPPVGFLVKIARVYNTGNRRKTSNARTLFVCCMYDSVCGSRAEGGGAAVLRNCSGSVACSRKCVWRALFSSRASDFVVLSCPRIGILRLPQATTALSSLACCVSAGVATTMSTTARRTGRTRPPHSARLPSKCSRTPGPRREKSARISGRKPNSSARSRRALLSPSDTIFSLMRVWGSTLFLSPPPPRLYRSDLLARSIPRIIQLASSLCSCFETSFVPKQKRGGHGNIIRFFGYVLGKEMKMLTDFAAQGSLLSYLRAYEYAP